MMKRMIALCLILLLALPFARAEENVPAVSDVGLDLMGSSVHYPQVTGLPDAQVQQAVNAAILEAGQIENRLNRMAMLLSSPVKLTVTYQYALMGDVFSCAFLAEGAVENSRATQVWSAVNIDLTTGASLSLDDLFTDGAAARTHMEALLAEEVAPEMSAHLASGQLSPLPETFSFTNTGLTLHYPIEQFRTLSDRAGTVRFLWYELAEFLPDQPVAPMDRTALADLMSKGNLPGLPVQLGDAMQEVIDRYALLNDPDIYEGGRMIALEDDRFRKVWLLTDALTEDFAKSIVQGIRADRMQLGGLITGKTTMAEWRALLGDPETTLAVDAARAEGWRIVPGSSDYYDLGGIRLRLHADENGTLRSIFITK